jgi:hypothetical protein
MQETGNYYSNKNAVVILKDIPFATFVVLLICTESIK